jgi:hypothetical protein
MSLPSPICPARYQPAELERGDWWILIGVGAFCFVAGMLLGLLI